ncbi:ABC transporter permease [Actinomyces wuliandei]|uniref:ABC transporter permease n=1 Tax=Actinomyces wuliandei TaxID=2057743 RepID=UPI000FDC2D89|nr:ABC transporter permease [Actinomyces wuliandei]
MTSVTMTTSMPGRPSMPGQPTTTTGQVLRPSASTPAPIRPSPHSGTGGWLRERILLPLALEHAKSRRPWILPALALALAALNVANGAGRYMSYTESFQAQGITWQVVWGQGGLLWSVFFLPMLITFHAAGLTRMEHEHDNWRRMATYGAATTTYTGKLALITLFALYCQTAFLLLVLAASTALGFHLTLTDLATMTTWVLLGTLGAVTIATAQLLIGIYVPSLATTVLTGLGASFLSLALTLVAPPLTGIYPYSQATIGMQARTLSTPSPAGLTWFLVWNGILITATVLLSRRALRKKQH